MGDPSEKDAARWRILAVNSLFGYQYELGIQPGHFAICICPDLTTEEEEQVRQQSGASSLVIQDFIGYTYIRIHWTDYERVNAIFDTMLANGHWFRTRNAAEVAFNPRKGDTHFTDKVMESKCISGIKELMETSWWLEVARNDPENGIFLKRQALEPWNYVTPEGRDFCIELRKTLELEPLSMDSNWNYWRWQEFKDE